MLPALLLVTVFAAVVLAVWGVFTLVAQAPVREQQKVIGYRLDALLRAQERGAGDTSVELFKQELLSSLPALDRMLLQLPRARVLQRALRQADWDVSVVVFLLLSGGAAAGALVAGLLLWRSLPLAAVAALGAAFAPYLLVVWKRRKRLDRFYESFPEAIDLMARAIRAGHAINAGLEMVADEMEGPVAKEFRQTHDEQKFGLPLNQALVNLQERVPLLDVRMLGTAIAIQREVGGNLGEVLDKIAFTIRERLKIRRQVRVYTAQGRLTGYVLAALPIFLGLGLFTINPDYFTVLFSHRFGPILIGLAALLQILGFFWIRKIIHIKI